MSTTIHGVVAKVLLIEDDPQCAKDIQRALHTNERGLSFHVSIASSAAEAAPFIKENKTDIYIVDLELPEFDGAPNEKVGEALSYEISRSTYGGVIIYSSKLQKDREDYLWHNIDDCISKNDPPSYVAAKAFSVWRRVQDARHELRKPQTKKFKLGKWQFEAGNRTLVSESGEIVRLSATEHAFVEYLCTVDTQLDRREFNVDVLKREPYEEDMRIDNLVYRLREKLGDSFQIVSRSNGGSYKLLSYERL